MEIAEDSGMTLTMYPSDPATAFGVIGLVVSGDDGGAARRARG
jgi:hypothetical protein